jgi:hypothetical protein
MSLIVYGIIQAPAWGWASASTIGALATGAAVLAVLVAAERATASPMIDVSLFRNPRFTAAAASVAISFFALLGFIFLMTQYFQVVRAYSPLSTGVRLLPVAVTVGVAAVAGTRLAVRIGNKVIVGGGMLFFCAALAWIANHPVPGRAHERGSTRRSRAPRAPGTQWQFHAAAASPGAL